MTEPGEKGLGVLLAESVQQGSRPVSRELLLLPIPFPENEHVESERLRSLSRAVRSRVVGRGVRSMNEIYSKTSASEAGSRPSSLLLTSLSRIKLQCLSGDKRCRVQVCRGSLHSALRFCAWIHQ